MRPVPISQRRSHRILRLIPHHPLHDCPIHRDTVHGLRILVESDEPEKRVRPNHSLRCWRSCRSICSRDYNALGCDQNVAPDTWIESRAGNPECERADACCEHHQASVWLEWVHARMETEDNHDDAEYRDLLVCLLVSPFEDTLTCFRSSYEMAKAYFRKGLVEEYRASQL